RETHVGHVVGKHRREFTIGERTASVLKFAAPGVKMNLINRKRPVGRSGSSTPAGEPRGIVPLVAARVAHDGGVSRWRLEKSAIGVGLDLQAASRADHLKLVEFSLAKA